MAADGASVGSAENDVHVNDGFAVEGCDVADEGEDFNLFGDGDALVDLLGGGEPGEGCAADGSDCGEVCVLEFVLDGEVGEAAEGLVAVVEDDDVDFFFGGVFD